MSKLQEPVFKQCPSCRKKWPDYTEFLADPCLKLIGYQMFLEELKEGLFLFNHSCGTTLSITVETLAHLYNGPVHEKRAIGSDNCPGFCLFENETGPCSEECDCAYVRSIMQIIQSWNKSERTEP